MYRTILVPFDGSALSAAALPVAVELARRTAATVHLALVHDPSPAIPLVAGEVAVPIFDHALERERRAAEARTLDAAAGTLRAAGVPAMGTLLEGRVEDALDAYAERIGADLLVMTTHGRGGFQRLRLGSVTTALLTRATRPVLVLRLGDAAAPPAFPTGPLACALDGTPFSEAMLPHARAFAAAAGLPLHYVGVTVPHAVPMAPFGAESMIVDDAALAAESASRRAYLSRLAGTPAEATIAALVDMSASRALLDEARRVSAGAIAVACHGRGGVGRFVLGSTTDELIRHASVPVLVYRPHAGT